MKKPTIITASFALVLAIGVLVFGPVANSFAQEDPIFQGQPIQTGFANTLSDSNNEDALEHAIAVALDANWGDNVSLTIDGTTLVVSSDGVPNHDVGTFPRGGGEAFADPYNLNLEIPLNPVLADEPTPTNMGAIGVAVSGAVFYNPYDGGGEFAIGTVLLDACNAHPSPNNAYHYHGVPYCITDLLDTNGEHSVLIGYLLDGFPIYGPQDENGEIPTDLDECNGHFGSTPEFPEGIYHYHTTETASYVPECYGGEVTINGAGGGGFAPSVNGEGSEQPADGQQPVRGQQNGNRPPRRP